MINAKVNIDIEGGEIQIPKVLSEYGEDFGGTE